MKRLELLLAIGSVMLLISCSLFNETDLSETYFPFGLEYEWCYQRNIHESVFSNLGDGWDSFWCDTVKIQVCDSLKLEQGWRFTLRDDGFYDVGNSIDINADKITVWGLQIHLHPHAGSTTNEDGDTITISYSKDTLILTIGWIDEYAPHGVEFFQYGTSRTKEIGIVKQWFEEGTFGNIAYSLSESYRLLWFYNGRDTVYKAAN